MLSVEHHGRSILSWRSRPDSNWALLLTRQARRHLRFGTIRNVWWAARDLNPELPR